MAKTWDWTNVTATDSAPFVGYVEASVSSTTGLITNDNFELYWYSLEELGGELEGVWSSYEPTESFASDHAGYTFLEAYYMDETGTDEGTPWVVFVTAGRGWTSGTWETATRPVLNGKASSSDDINWVGDVIGYSDEEAAALKQLFSPDDIIDDLDENFLNVYDGVVAQMVEDIKNRVLTSQNTLNFKKAKAIDIEAKNISAFEAEEVKTASTAITVSTAMTTGY